MKIRVKDGFLYRDGGVRDSITPHYSAPPPNRVKPLLEFLDDIAPPITPQEPEITPQELSPEQDPEATRIAAELQRLYQDGAIAKKSAKDPDASFYANLLHTFGATYIGPNTPAPAEPGASPSASTTSRLRRRSPRCRQ